MASEPPLSPENTSRDVVSILTGETAQGWGRYHGLFVADHESPWVKIGPSVLEPRHKVFHTQAMSQTPV